MITIAKPLVTPQWSTVLWPRSSETITYGLVYKFHHFSSKGLSSSKRNLTTMFFKWWQWLPGLYRYTFSFMVEQLSNISQLSSTLVPSVAISTFWTVPCLCKTRRVTYQLVWFHSWESKGTPPPQEIAGLIQDSLRGLWWVHGPLIRPYFLGWRRGCSLDSHYPLHQGEYLDKRSRSSGSPVVLSKFFTKTCKFFPISLHSPLEDD